MVAHTVKTIAGSSAVGCVRCLVEIVSLFRLGDRQHLAAWAPAKFTERGIEVDGDE